MTTQEQLDRLTQIVGALAGSVVAHDNQIEALLKIAEQHSSAQATDRERVRELVQAIANLERQWQAYINTLPRH